MKRFISYFMMAIMATSLFTACDDESGTGGDDSGNDYDFTEILNNYTDKMVLSTYADLRDKSTILAEAAAIVAEDPSADNISAACEAWRTARIPWEQSEAFLYGPAEIHSLDPSLDSWPLDKNSIDKILLGNQDIATVIGDAGVRGFHTIEYLIFTGGKPKMSMTNREIEYLIAATEALNHDCIKLWASWVGEDAFIEEYGGEFVADFDLSAGRGYAYQFKKAGTAGSSYLSQGEAIDEIVNGCVNIAGEVGSQKINGPYSETNKEKAVLDVESWYSYNSLTDFKNNIESIRGAYFGGKNLTKASVNSISAYVKEKNSQLDADIIAAINNAYNAINNITSPFRDRVYYKDENTKVNAAIEACMDLEEILIKVKALSKKK